MYLLIRRRHHRLYLHSRLHHLRDRGFIFWLIGRLHPGDFWHFWGSLTIFDNFLIPRLRRTKTTTTATTTLCFGHQWNYRHYHSVSRLFAWFIKKGWCLRDWSTKVDFDKTFDREILAIFKNWFKFPASFSAHASFVLLNGHIHAIFDYSIVFSGKQQQQQQQQQAINSITGQAEYPERMLTSSTVHLLFSALRCVYVANQWTKRPTNRHTFSWRCKKHIAKHDHANEQK